MAKGSSAPAPAAAPAPAPSAPAPASPSPIAANQPTGERLVIQWNNDDQDAGLGANLETTAPAPARQADKEPLVIEHEDGKTAPKPDAEEPGKEPPAAAKADDKPTASERRRSTLAALEAEKKVRQLEETLKAEQTAAAAAKADAARLQKAIKEGTLGDLLQERGMTAEQALEMLLVGGDKVKPTKEAPKPEESELAKLRELVEGLKQKLDDRDKKDETTAQEYGKQQEKQAVEAIVDMTKDLDIPVTRAVDNGHILILQTAHQMWLNEGKSGVIADYVPEAAKLAEGHWRKEKPALAALADRAKGAPAADPAPSVGRRNGSRPTSNGKPSLWKPDASGQLPSREEIDAIIKREMNFVDKH